MSELTWYDILDVLPGASAVPSEPGLEAWGNSQMLEAEAALAALAEWLSPHPGPSRRVVVPDVRGLFIGTCRQALGGGLRMQTVLLTQHPMPVEGLVVGQSPLPGGKVHRFSTLTVQVWHPPRRG